MDPGVLKMFFFLVKIYRDSHIEIWVVSYTQMKLYYSYDHSYKQIAKKFKLIKKIKPFLGARLNLEKSLFFYIKKIISSHSRRI